MTSALASLRSAMDATRRLLTPFTVPAELTAAMDELHRQADAVRIERVRLDQALVGAQASMIAGVLSAHDRLRGPRDV